MLIDLSPLKKQRDFRLLFIGQSISVLGSMINYMAVPYQVYQLTKSNALGIAQLISMLIFGLLGGTYADHINRRRLMLCCEAALLLSGWSSLIVRQGRAVIIAAVLWGLCVLGAGMAQALALIVLCLILAGAADMVSSLFASLSGITPCPTRCAASWPALR